MHYKEDPFHAPLLHHSRCSTVDFASLSGVEAFNRWRAFAGGKYFGEVAALLDKGQTPVKEQLLERAISKYGRRHNLQAATLRDIPEGERAGLLCGHVVFKEAVHPALAMRSGSYHDNDSVRSVLQSVEERELEKKVDNSCTQSEFQQWVPKVDDHRESATGNVISPGSAVFVTGTRRGAKSTICAIRCAGKKKNNLAHQPATSASSIFEDEFDWFFCSLMTLEGRPKPISAADLQTSLALPKNALIPNLFRGLSK